jgi:hypothetical protein
MDNRSSSASGAIITFLFGIVGAAAAIIGFILVFSQAAVVPGVGGLILGMLLMGTVVFRGQKLLGEQPGNHGQTDFASSAGSPDDR